MDDCSNRIEVYLVEMTIANQLYHLFLSCGLGFVLGAYYDVFRVIRLIMNSKNRTVFLQDMLFFSTSAVITFLFSLAVTEGNLRFYLFAGEIIGFFAYHYTMGKIVVRFAGTVTAAILFIWGAILKVISFPFRLIKRPLTVVYRKITAFFRKKSLKLHIFLKKGLKHAGKILYNRTKSE